MLATGSNPSVVVSNAPVQPTAVPKYKDRWVKRVYQASVSTTDAATLANFTVDSFGVPTDTVVYVDKVQVWNLSANAKGVEVTFKATNTTDLGSDDVVATDWSSLGQCPGVTFKVPLGHAKGVSNATVVVAAKPLPSGTGAFVFVTNLHCWVAV